MSVAAAGRVPMSWVEYERLPDDVPGEYVHGHLVRAPSPSRGHQRVCWRLAALLDEAVGGDHEANVAWQWIPDVMVYRRTADTARYTGTPLLCVEVLSTNRAADLRDKLESYAHFGVEHYWVLDPVGRTLVAYVLVQDSYQERARA